MGRLSKIIIIEELEDLKLVHKSENNPQLQRKLKCLIYTKEKKYSTQEILANNIGVDYATVKRWLKQYSEETLESYLSVKRGGNRKSVVSKELHDALSNKLNSSLDPLKGYWDVQMWIKKEFDLDLKYHTIRSYLIRHFKTKLKSPRKSHYKKDEQAIEAFFKTPRNI
jgi:transposase